MSSLAELSSKMPKKEEPVREIAGDELMAKAQGMVKVNDDDLASGKLFYQSSELVKARMAADESYASTVSPVLKEAQAKSMEDFYEVMIDEADKLKIEKLQQENPDWFNEGRSALGGFLNSATFGQLSRITGKAKELIDGVPYEQVVEQEAEKLRLLEKAFPKSFVGGEVASFLIPGSPVKALFTKSLQVGAKVASKAAAKGLFAKVSKNPAYLQKIAQGVIGATAGEGARQGIEGTLGSDLQSISFDRGAEDSLKGAATGGAMAALLPLGSKAGVKALKSVAGPVNQGVGRIAQALTGTNEKALRAYAKNPEGLKNAFGTEAEIGNDLVDFLVNQKKSGVTEVKLADQLLDQLPDVDPKPLLNYLKSFKKGVNPKLDNQVDLLHEWADRIDKSIGGAKKISARSMRQFVDDLQNAADDAFGQESDMYMTGLKVASRRARMQIVDAAAKEGGEIGKTYNELMSKGAAKVGMLKYIGKRLGSTEDMQRQRAEGFVSNLFGRNKTVMQRMQDLDAKFGTNFAELAETAALAKQAGPGGVPELLSASPNGRSLYGSAVGGIVGSVLPGVGTSVGAATGAIASSPRVGSIVLGASDKISGFIKRLNDNPAILERMAGSGKGPGVRMPAEVIQLSKDLYKTLKKDGPISMGSSMRLVADSPFFIGLVHYADVIDRQTTSRKGVQAVQNARQSEIAKEE